MVAARNIGALTLAVVLLCGWLEPAVAEKMKALPQDVLDAMDKDDYDKLRELVVPLAEGGGDLAQSLLGIMYENGVGVEKDYAKAVYWYIKAGEQGDLRSQLNLGDMYRAGLGTEVDWKQAKLWYSRAAAQGQMGPQETYARFLHDTGDEEEAVVWLRKLAPAGSAVATNRWNAIVLPPSPESRPAVCYVETEAARWIISHTPKGQGGSMIFLHADAGCGVHLQWPIPAGLGEAEQRERSMGESAANEISSAGFVTLPPDLKVEVKGCPQDWQKMTTLSQEGHSLSLKEPAGSSPSLHFGAIVENHIVLVSGVAVEVEAYFGLTAAYSGLVLGDWQDGRAELVSPSGDCRVTVTAP